MSFHPKSRRLDQVSRTPSRRSFLGLAGGLGAAATLAACGGSTAGNQTPAGGNGGAAYKGPRVNIKFWTGWTGADGAIASKMVNEFNAQTPNVRVEMSIFQWADFLQKLPSAVHSGNGPDVAAMHIDDMPTQAAQQVIVPIDDVATALGLRASDFTTAVWQGGIYQGKRYAIPIDVHCLGLFYNKTVMAKAGLDPGKPPQTGTDYLAACEVLKGKGIRGSWVSPFQFTGAYWFESLLWQFGGDTFDSQVTKATWDSGAGVQALTWMVDLVKMGYSPANVGQDADYIALKNGQNAFNWQGIWQVNEATTLPNQSIGVAPLPRVGPHGGVWGDSHQFVIPRQRSGDVHKNEAGRYFINWFTRHELEWAGSAKVPASKALASSPQFQAMKILPQFGKELNDVHFPPSTAGIDDALAELYTGINSAVLMKQSPAAALSAAATRANRILQDNAQKYGH